MPVSRTRRQHLSNLLFEGFVSRAHAGPSVVPGAFSGQGRIPIDAEACITFGTVRGWEAMRVMSPQFLLWKPGNRDRATLPRTE